MAGDNDVVVADGVGEEIAGLGGVGEAYDLLGAAEVGLRLVSDERSFCDEAARQVAGDLGDGDVAQGHEATDGGADARLEMGVQLVALHHV